MRDRRPIRRSVREFLPARAVLGRWDLRRRFWGAPFAARIIAGFRAFGCGSAVDACDFADEPLVGGAERGDTCRCDAEEDFPRAPVPVWDAYPCRVVGYILPVKDCAHDGERAGDDAEAHEGAEADFGAEADLDFTQDEDGEGGEEEIGYDANEGLGNDDAFELAFGEAFAGHFVVPGFVKVWCALQDPDEADDYV